MRNFLIIITGILLLNAILLYSGAFAYIQELFAPEEVEPSINAEVVDTFRQTLEEKVREELGMPIEGYEPLMFLATFPGLTETDFDGVESSIGNYAFVDGALEHQLGESRLVHSAAGAITRRGYETLYRNVAKRLGIDIHNGGTLTDVMRSIATP